MFDYFSYSSNAHQVRCEDSPTKGISEHCQSDDPDLHSSSHVRLKQYLSYYIRTWHDGRLMDALCAHARFDYLGLDTRSQLVGKCKKLSSACSRQLNKEAILWDLDFDFANVYMACPTCFILLR